MPRDDILLLDMLLAARDAVEFAAGLTSEAFERNRMAQRATLKSVEIVGEAASRIGVETKEAHPEIPWAAIVGMRNRLVHEYSNVNLKRVWEVVQHDIPHLIAQLESLVPPEEE